MAWYTRPVTNGNSITENGWCKVVNFWMMTHEKHIYYQVADDQVTALTSFHF